MEEPPPEKPLQKVSFSAHVAQGVIRDLRTRRRAMFVLLVVAMLMVFLGATLLADALSPREHIGWFVLFWGTCAWLTVTVLLLAVFDLLLLRREARRARNTCKANLSKELE